MTVCVAKINIPSSHSPDKSGQMIAAGTFFPAAFDFRQMEKRLYFAPPFGARFEPPIGLEPAPVVVARGG